MELNKLNDINYLKSLANNFELLKEVVTNDSGVILNQMLVFGVCPDKETLLKMNCPQADLFILKNYTSNEDGIKLILSRDLISCSISNDSLEQETITKYLKQPICKSTSRLPFNIAKLPPQFKEEEHLISILEYYYLRKECFSEYFNDGDVIKNLFISIFCNPDKPEIENFIKTPGVIQLFKSVLKSDHNIYIDFKEIKKIWEASHNEKVDLSLLSSLFYDYSNIHHFMDDILKYLKNENLDINDIFEYLPELIQKEVVLDENLPNYSNKNINKLISVSDSDFKDFSKSFKNVLKPESFKLKENLLEVLENLNKIKIVNDPDGVSKATLKLNDEDWENYLFEKIIDCTESFKNGNSLNGLVTASIKNHIPTFMINYEKYQFVWGNESRKKVFDDFIDEVRTDFLKKRFNFYINDEITFPSIMDVGEDSLYKLFLLGGNSINSLSNASGALKTILKKMLIEKSDLVNDYLTILNGGEISLSSPVFEDVKFKKVNGKFHYENLNLFSKEMQNKIFKEWEIEWPFNVKSISTIPSYVIPKEFLNFVEFSEKNEMPSVPRDIQFLIAYAKDTHSSMCNLLEHEVFNHKFLKSYFDECFKYQEEFNDNPFKYNDEIKNSKEQTQRVRVLHEKRVFISHVLYCAGLVMDDNAQVKVMRDMSENYKCRNFQEAEELSALMANAIEHKSSMIYKHYVFNRIKNREVDNDIPIINYAYVLGIKSSHNFDLTLDDKVYAFKQMFKNNTDHYLQSLSDDVSSFNLNEIFDDNKKAQNEVLTHILENSPSVILSDYYYGLTRANNLDMNQLYDAYLNINKEIGIEFNRKNSTNKKNENIWLEVLKNHSEEDYWNLNERAKLDFPELYTVLVSPLLVKALSVDGHALDYPYAFWSSENPDVEQHAAENFAWSITDVDVLVEGYDKIKNSVINVNKKYQFKDKVLILKDWGLSDTGSLLYLVNDKSFATTLENAESFVSKLLDKDLGFFSIIMQSEETQQISNCFSKKITSKVKTLEDAQKVFLGLLYYDGGVIYGDEFSFSKMKKYEVNESAYKDVLFSLCQNLPGFAEVSKNIIDNYSFMKSESLYLSPHNPVARLLSNQILDENLELLSGEQDVNKVLLYGVSKNHADLLKSGISKHLNDLDLPDEIEGSINTFKI